MKTFHFYLKNGNANLTISGKTFDEAEKELSEIVINLNWWRCDNEDGEDEE